jgi:Putative  PD-(D/E)XK family member, (DUF4420)
MRRKTSTRTRWRATLNEDPWRGIAPPSASQSVNAKRVDADLKWDFFWARDVEGHCLLLLTYGHESAPHGHLPKVKGIELSTATAFDDDHEMLIYSLADAAQRDIFYKLCRDIVSSTVGAVDEKDAVATAVRRTWRWHHLLRGGSDGRLTVEEQKGLIGEFLVLKRYLLPAVDVADALTAWHGPLRAPKDFELGMVCIEAKARRGPAKPFIAVSSEYQLDTEGTETLFLHVVDLDRASGDDEQACTVTTVARRVLDEVLEMDDAQGDVLETLLAAAGFRWEDDYSDHKWLEGASRIFRVSSGFPRISAADLPPGVSEVKYQISLQDCAPFETTREDLSKALKGSDA